MTEIKITQDTKTVAVGKVRTRWFLSYGGVPVGRRAGYNSLRAAQEAKRSIDTYGRE